jgi:hypothetical protein
MALGPPVVIGRKEQSVKYRSANSHTTCGRALTTGAVQHCEDAANGQTYFRLVGRGRRWLARALRAPVAPTDTNEAAVSVTGGEGVGQPQARYYLRTQAAKHCFALDYTQHPTVHVLFVDEGVVDQSLGSSGAGNRAQCARRHLGVVAHRAAGAVAFERAGAREGSTCGVREILHNSSRAAVCGIRTSSKLCQCAIRWNILLWVN